MYMYISTNFIDLPPSLVTPINCLYRGCGLHLGFPGVCTLFQFHRELTSRRVLFLHGKYEIRLALLLAPANIRRVLLAPVLVIQFIDVLEKGKKERGCLGKVSLPYVLPVNSRRAGTVPACISPLPTCTASGRVIHLHRWISCRTRRSFPRSEIRSISKIDISRKRSISIIARIKKKKDFCPIWTRNC